MSFVAALPQDVCKAPCCAPPGCSQSLRCAPQDGAGPLAALPRMCPGPFAGLPGWRRAPRCAPQDVPRALRWAPRMCPKPFAALPRMCPRPFAALPGTTKLNQERGSRAMAKKGEGAPWNRGGAVAEFGGRRITGQLQSARFRRGRLWGGGRLRRWSGPAG
jgi:hypothetical protein